jgi:hypothetical protein
MFVELIFHLIVRLYAWKCKKLELVSIIKKVKVDVHAIVLFMLSIQLNEKKLLENYGGSHNTCGTNHGNVC